MCISIFTLSFHCPPGSANLKWSFVIFVCLCAVKPVVPRCSVPEAVTVGTSTELRCLENEGFPAPMYRWFHNNEELPQDSKTSPKFVNSSYSINPDTGGLVRKTGGDMILVYSVNLSVFITCTNLKHAYFCLFNCTTCIKSAPVKCVARR